MKREIDGKTYMVDARGSLVPEESVKPIDLLRDDLVHSIADEVLALREKMKDLKVDSMQRIENFVRISAARHGVRIGGEKGNLSLKSFDGSMKIDVGISESLDLTESVHAAKKMIDDYLEEITKDANADLKTIVGKAFRVKQGRMDVKRILELRSYNITDPRWTKAMDIIADSIQIASSTQCLRIYKRSDDDGRYQILNLDFNTL